jgi:hypothetical protein
LTVDQTGEGAQEIVCCNINPVGPKMMTGSEAHHFPDFRLQSGDGLQYCPDDVSSVARTVGLGHVVACFRFDGEGLKSLQSPCGDELRRETVSCVYGGAS